MNSQSIIGHQAGILTVAIAAQLSFLATLLLIGILIYYRLRLWDPKSRSVIGSDEFCLKFLRSQFAIRSLRNLYYHFDFDPKHLAQLFIDLLASDLIQALGFLLNLAHVGKHSIDDSAVCTVQGVLIQLGDTSGSFATIIIAIHTFMVLINRMPPSTSALLIVLGIKWALVFILTMIGPLAFAKEALGPFYGPAGGWCWIRNTYPWERLWLHYAWLYLAGASSAVTYVLIFWNVRRRLRTQYASTSCDRSAEEVSMENAAKKMLVYPLCYLLLMLPLGIVRTSAIFGHNWSLDTQMICGVIFTLAGLVDSVVFCWTRNIFSIRIRSASPATESTPHIVSQPSEPDGSEPKTSQSPPPFLWSRDEAPAPITAPKPAQKSLASRINGSATLFVPAKYSLATIDMNSFDETEPSK